MQWRVHIDWNILAETSAMDLFTGVENNYHYYHSI